MSLVAVRYQQTFTHGHSRPLLIAAEDPLTDRRHEIVLKLAPDMQSGHIGLAVEMICAELAARIGLLAARGWCVEVGADFAGSVPDSDARRRLGQATGTQFGSTYYTGQFHLPLADDAVGSALFEKAAAVLLFDALIGNDDRHREKPNCLVRGDEIVLIDHERAFPALRREIRPPAWEPGGLEFVPNHSFFSGLRGQLPDFSTAAEAWHAVTPAIAAELIATVPATWLDEAEKAQAVRFVVEMAKEANKVSALLTEMLR